MESKLAANGWGKVCIYIRKDLPPLTANFSLLANHWQKAFMFCHKNLSKVKVRTCRNSNTLNSTVSMEGVPSWTPQPNLILVHTSVSQHKQVFSTWTRGCDIEVFQCLSREGGLNHVKCKYNACGSSYHARINLGGPPNVHGPLHCHPKLTHTIVSSCKGIQRNLLNFLDTFALAPFLHFVPFLRVIMTAPDSETTSTTDSRILTILCGSRM